MVRLRDIFTKLSLRLSTYSPGRKTVIFTSTLGTLLVVISIIFFSAFVGDHNKLLTKLDQKETELQNLRKSIGNIPTDAPRNKTITDNSNLVCPPPDSESIYTPDQKYYTSFENDNGLRICDKNTNKIPGESTGKVSDGKYAIFTYSLYPEKGGVFFIVDLINRSIKYMRGEDISSEIPYPSLYGPFIVNAWSPNNDYLLVRMSGCFGCTTTSTTFAYNINDNTFTKIGDIYQSDFTWTSDTTLKWMSLTEKVNPSNSIDEFPVTVEPNGYVSTKLN